MMRSVLLAIDSIPSSYLGQPIVHLHFVTKFKSWTLGFSLRVPNRSGGPLLAGVGERAVATAHAFSGERLFAQPALRWSFRYTFSFVASSPLSVCSCRLLAGARCDRGSVL